MDDFKSVVPIVKNAFVMNPDDPVDYIIKYGIHNMFAESITEPNGPQEQIKRCIINALAMVATINPDMELNGDGDDEDKAMAAGQEKIQTRYFSSRHGCLVEFFISGATGKYDIKTTNEYTTVQTKPSTPEQTKNDKFKSAVIDTFLSFDPNPMERLILTGVIMTLEFAEDRDGPFMDLFKENYALLGKIKPVYEKECGERLAADNGDFSVWCDVESAVMKYELDKEDFARMMEG
jgi:hypothetical protein